MAEFTFDEFRRLFALDASAASAALHRLTRAGTLRRLRRGHYLATTAAGERAQSNALFLATRVVTPAYISFLSALHLYGWTDQVPQEVIVATTARLPPSTFDRFRFRTVRLANFRYFGYEDFQQDELHFPVAEPEKAFVDSLFRLGEGGGLRTVESSLEAALPSLDSRRLMNYARRMRTLAVLQRLGFLCEELGQPLVPAPPIPARSYIRLDPRLPRRGVYSKRWKLLDNRPERRT